MQRNCAKWLKRKKESIGALSDLLKMSPDWAAAGFASLLWTVNLGSAGRCPAIFKAVVHQTAVQTNSDQSFVLAKTPGGQQYIGLYEGFGRASIFWSLNRLGTEAPAPLGPQTPA